MAKSKKPRGISKKDWDDVDSPPLTKKQIQSMRPLKEADPGLYEMFAKRRGRPAMKFPKRQLTLRLSSELVDDIKSSGPGYNVRIERILREARDKGRL